MLVVFSLIALGRVLSTTEWGFWFRLLVSFVITTICLAICQIIFQITEDEKEEKKEEEEEEKKEEEKKKKDD